MKCYHCNKEFDITQKIGFKETCPHCDGYLHCCHHCKYHKLGHNNECLIPNTEMVKDRAHFNYCDEFSLNEEQERPHYKNIKDIETKLFGKSEEKDKKNPFDRFNSIFKDP